MDTKKIIQRAQHSSFYRWMLNLALNRMVPFNRPHGLRVLEISGQRVKVLLPYRKANLNHIRGLHACALATASEFATGFLLVSLLDGSNFRLIMQRLEMDYHYQGKMNAFAEFSIPEMWMQENIYLPLKNSESVVVTCTVKIHDENGAHLSTGNVHWQVKEWRKVKTAA